jgi:hypothetical protein
MRATQETLSTAGTRSRHAQHLEKVVNSGHNSFVADCRLGKVQYQSKMMCSHCTILVGNNTIVVHPQQIQSNDSRSLTSHSSHPLHELKFLSRKPMGSHAHSLLVSCHTTCQIHN